MERLPDTGGARESFPEEVRPVRRWGTQGAQESWKDSKQRFANILQEGCPQQRFCFTSFVNFLSGHLEKKRKWFRDMIFCLLTLETGPSGERLM